jgi:hypothetical protein
MRYWIKPFQVEMSSSFHPWRRRADITSVAQAMKATWAGSHE